MWFSRYWQLNKVEMRRTLAPYAYLLVLGAATATLLVLLRGRDHGHADRVETVMFLAVAGGLLNLPDVRIEQGRISLGGLALGASSVLLSPMGASIVGLASSVSLVRRGRFSIVAGGILAASTGCLAATLAVLLSNGDALSFGQRLLVLVAWAVIDLVLVATTFQLRAGQNLVAVIRLNLSLPFVMAFAYFALAALLISYVLDGTGLGFLLAMIVCVLALALTDTMSGRRVRRVLESELSDADRHLVHSRAVEGVVHNLRNHMATAVGYLNEIDPRRLDPIDRESVETATAAANDAVTVLRTLSQGATPRVNFALEPIDLNELISRAMGMARPRARGKEVQLALRESPDDVRVRADPLLLREVVTNLVNNAIEAVPISGRVELRTGLRSNGWPYLSVADNGPGVAEANRHHLFEPHFTTKEGGTGLGLFMSYGIVREHQGDLLFDHNHPHGAVFTVMLPPFTG
jgi:signal transduction histidine kinase